ncbi:Scr1 family TA system antitoxin-like transcriptional regulator [Streptomyces sp. NPDC050485]|uniref:Scr1 family TA system antitoxin-like transcriptional regulator n=1 Tax=Streptomyces sp. NPDC050485 TaxID=3365617 RepID=UPI00378F7DEC
MGDRPQLERLRDSFDLPGLKMGVIPDRTQLDIYPGNSFSIFDGKRVELENLGDNPTHTDRQQVTAYQRAFELLARGAVYGDEARTLIQTELGAL